MTAALAHADAFDVEAAARAIAEEAAPKGGYGAVYELWFDAYDSNTRSILPAGVPEAHLPAVEARLVELGALKSDDWEDPREDNPDLCRHYLDANTCPCGCFEGDDEDFGGDPCDETDFDDWDELEDEHLQLEAEDAACELALIEEEERAAAEAEELDRAELEAELAEFYNTFEAEPETPTEPRPSLLSRILNALLRR